MTSPLRAAANLAEDLVAPRLRALADHLETMAGVDLSAAPVMRKQMRAEGERLRSETAGALEKLADMTDMSARLEARSEHNMLHSNTGAVTCDVLRSWASAWVLWANSVDPE